MLPAMYTILKEAAPLRPGLGAFAQLAQGVTMRRPPTAALASMATARVPRMARPMIARAAPVAPPQSFGDLLVRTKHMAPGLPRAQAMSGMVPVHAPVAGPLAARAQRAGNAFSAIELSANSALRQSDPAVLRGGAAQAAALPGAAMREGMELRPGQQGLGWKLNQLIRNHPEYVRARAVAVGVPQAVRPKIGAWFKRAAIMQTLRRYGVSSAVAFTP